MFSSHFLTKVLLQLEAIILWEVIVSQTIFCMFCTFFWQWTVKMIFLSGKCRIGFRRIASQIICYTSKLPRVSNYFSLFHYADNVKYLNLLGWPPLFRRFEETSSLPLPPLPPPSPHLPALPFEKNLVALVLVYIKNSAKWMILSWMVLSLAQFSAGQWMFKVSN